MARRVERHEGETLGGLWDIRLVFCEGDRKVLGFYIDESEAARDSEDFLDGSLTMCDLMSRTDNERER